MLGKGNNMTHEEINRYKVAIAEEKEENAYLRERVRKAEHKLDAIVDILKDGAPKYAPVNRMVISERLAYQEKITELENEIQRLDCGLGLCMDRINELVESFTNGN